MYYGARYYDPALARFITADTVYDAGPQGLNRYSYALNNPIRYNDPSGYFVNGPDDEQNPDGYGTVTGSAEQLHDGSATVHNYYGTHSLSYWEGLAGGTDPNATVFDVLSAYWNTATMGLDDLLLQPAIDNAVDYYGDNGHPVLKGAVFLVGTVFSMDDLSPKDAKRVYHFLDDVFTDVQKKIPDLQYRILDMEKSGFYKELNKVLFSKHNMSGQVIAEELQHALDDVQGWSHRNPDFLKTLIQEGFDLSTKKGMREANHWWHRRVYVRAIKNIQAENPGFRKLQPSIEAIYKRYQDRAGGQLTLEQILSTDFEGLY